MDSRRSSRLDWKSEKKWEEGILGILARLLTRKASIKVTRLLSRSFLKQRFNTQSLSIFFFSLIPNLHHVLDLLHCKLFWFCVFFFSCCVSLGFSFFRFLFFLYACVNSNCLKTFLVLNVLFSKKFLLWKKRRRKF